MGRAYSEDLRQRIVDAVDGGMSRRQAAALYKVSVSSAIRYVQRWHDSGTVEPSRMGQPEGSKLDPHRVWLLRLIENEPDITLSEIGERLKTEHQVKACIGTLWKFFNRNDISFKKNRARRRAGTA